MEAYISELKSHQVDFLDYCKFAFKKYRFEHYSLKKRADENISDEHYIIKGKYREILKNIIDRNECSEKDLKSVLEGCSEDELYYIGI